MKTLLLITVYETWPYGKVSWTIMTVPGFELPDRNAAHTGPLTAELRIRFPIQRHWNISRTSVSPVTIIPRILHTRQFTYNWRHLTQAVRTTCQLQLPYSVLLLSVYHLFLNEVSGQPIGSVFFDVWRWGR
jgi:hypothetical protein